MHMFERGLGGPGILCFRECGEYVLERAPSAGFSISHEHRGPGGRGGGSTTLVTKYMTCSCTREIASGVETRPHTQKFHERHALLLFISRSLEWWIYSILGLLFVETLRSSVHTLDRLICRKYLGNRDLAINDELESSPRHTRLSWAVEVWHNETD